MPELDPYTQFADPNVWWSKGADYAAITVFNYHDGEYPFDRLTTCPCHVMPLWDYHDGDWVEALEGTMGAEHAAPIIGTVIKDRFANEPKPNYFYTHSTIYRLWGTLDSITQAAREYAKVLTERLDSVGGDDDTFDYYPGAVEALGQICYALYAMGVDEARPLHDDLIKAALEGPYADWAEDLPIINEWPTERS